MMEIVKFLNHTWQEIPEQANPAKKYFETPEGLVKKECILIFKGKYLGVSDGGIVVAVNPKQGDITKKGVFWTVESAELFANALAMDCFNKDPKEPPEIFPGTREDLRKLSI